MRMNYKNFSVIFLCAISVCLFSVVLINLVVDPFYIFRTPFLGVQAQINDRYAKIEDLQKEKKKFNFYILGSSRMYYTRPDMVEKYIPFGKGYNLATIAATITEHLLHVNYLIKNGFSVETLYIGLDIDFCFTLKMHENQEYLLKLHPHVSNTNPIAFYWSYLTILPKGDIKRKLRANFGKKTSPKSQFGEDGALVLGTEAEDRQIFLENQGNLENIIKDKMSRENLEVLRELVALCRQYHIHPIIFITPHHRIVMDHFLEEDYISFLRGLSEITSFWDFSGYNSITTDSKNYLEHSHYHPSVSRLIAARIFNDRAWTVPGDFGVWVTKENIDSHLKNLKMSFEKRNRLQNMGQRLN
jgi:hypothetical protein